MNETSQIPDVDVRAIRAKLGLSQSRFAARFGFAVQTVQQWEGGRRRPAASARLLLLLIDLEPAAVERTLARVLAKQPANL